MKSTFHLVQDNLSSDTIKCLEQLLAEAKAGALIGIAYVSMYRRREYCASACGEARRNPTFTRGMLRALDDVLSDMVTR